MSKNNNANWDHYKVAGRERPGDAVHHEAERRQFSGGEGHASDAARRGPYIPNQERASQPAGAGDAGTPGREDETPDAQNISGSEEIEPSLSDDEGFTG